MFEAICCSCICKPLRPLWTPRWDCDMRRHRKFSLCWYGKWERVRWKWSSCYYFGTDFSKTAMCPCAHVENKSNDPLRDEPVRRDLQPRSLLFRLPRAAPDNFSWHERTKPTPIGPVTFTNPHTDTQVSNTSIKTKTPAQWRLTVRKKTHRDLFKIWNFSTSMRLNTCLKCLCHCSFNFRRDVNNVSDLSSPQSSVNIVEDLNMNSIWTFHIKSTQIQLTLHSFYTSIIQINTSELTN